VELDDVSRRGGLRRVPGSNAQFVVPTGGAAPAEEPAPRPEAAPARDAFRAFQSLGGGAAARPMRPAPSVTTSPSAPASMAPPPPPAPAAAPVDATGEAGRRISMVLRDLREAERVNPSAGGARFVAGRSFVLAQGIWQEDGLTVGAARVLRVRPMSRGYFALLRLRPALREALALGSVRLRLDTDRVLEVSDAAPDTAESAVEAFLR
jgi:hypothetical protein